MQPLLVASAVSETQSFARTPRLGRHVSSVGIFLSHLGKESEGLGHRRGPSGSQTRSKLKLHVPVFVRILEFPTGSFVRPRSRGPFWRGRS